MRYIVTGGTGFIGRALCRSLLNSGHHVQIFTRGVMRPPEGMDSRCELITWNPAQPGPWELLLDGADGVINLAGKNLFENRWKDAVKEELRASRVRTTEALAAAMGKVKAHPPVFVSASAVGYYGPHGDEALVESEPAGSDFLAGLAVAWEEAARKAEVHGVRVVRIRIGVVMGKGGGALPRMAKPFRFFMGGHVGSGDQWLSWIHIDDLVGIFRMALERQDVRGAVNATSPQPQRMRDFCVTLGSVMGRSSWFPVPNFMMRLTLGEAADVLLTGQKVLPKAANGYHYPFRFASCESALRDLLVAPAP